VEGGEVSHGNVTLTVLKEPLQMTFIDLEGHLSCLKRKWYTSENKVHN